MAKSADSRKKNFTIYHDAITVFGRNVLIKLLGWFYKGGETSYFDYITRRYGLRNLDHLINDTRKFALKYKTPKEYDLTLLHILLQLTCNLYDEKTQDNKDDKGYEYIEDGATALVSQSLQLDDYESGLTNSELSQRITELITMYSELIKQGGRLSGADPEECSKFSKEIRFGIMCLGHWVENSEYSYEKVNAVDYDYLDNMFTDFLADKFLAWMKKEEEREAQQKGKKKIKKDANHIKKIEDGKTVTISSSSATEESDKGTRKALAGKKNSGTSASVEKQASPKKSVPKASLCDTSSETKSSTSRTEATDIISNSKQSVEDTSSKKNNTKAFSQVNSNSKVTVSRESIHSMICEALRSEKFNKLQNGVSLLSHYMYTNISLKQHEMYSCEPGHQVRLKDLFNVKGMNDDIAEIIIVSGDVGMGKTWLMKYVLEKWRGDHTAVDKLGSRDLVIPYELQKNSCSNFAQLISSVLKDKVGDEVGEETLKEIVLGLPILVTLDGYDESCGESCQLVKEILQMSGTDVKVIITSRPQYVDTLYEQIPKHRRKRVSHLCLNNIPRSQHADFVMGMINSREAVNKDSAQLEEIKEGLIIRLPEIYDAIGEDLCNPLMLKIITAMWIEHPQIESNAMVKQLVV